jgi:hypothetical protein
MTKWKSLAISRKEPAGRRQNLPVPSKTICVSCYKEKYFDRLAFLRGQKTCLYQPQKHHKLTTKTPQKTITKTPIFRKTPCKNALSHSAKHFPAIKP